MATLDKRIQTLTQTASSTPQLQSGGASLTSDLVNAAGFGLEVYQKFQAQEELSAINEQQQLFNTQVQRGVAEFETLQREIEASGISGTRANVQVNRFLRGLADDNIRNAVLAESKKISGRSALDTVSDAESEALAMRQEVDELRLSAAELIRYSTKPLIDIESADREQLQSYILDATANKAQQDYDVLTTERNTATESNRANAALKVGGIEYNRFALNSIVSQATSIVQGVDLQDPASRTGALQLIRTLKQNLPLDFQQFMQGSHNVAISSSQATENLAPVNAMLDSLMNDLMGTDAVTMGANTLEQITQGMILSANQQNPEAIRAYLLAKDLKLPVQGLTDRAFLSVLDATESLGDQSTTRAVEKLEASLRAQGVSDKQITEATQLVRDMSTKASNNFKELTDNDRANLTNNLLQDLNPSTAADLVRHMEDGSINARAAELANPEQAQVYMGSAEEVGQALKRSTDLVVSKLGTQFFTQRTSGALSTIGGRGRTQSLGEFYRFENGQFVLRNTNVRPVQNDSTVRGLNNYLSNVIKAYQNLGLTEQEQNLKQELQQLFGDQDGQEGAN